ncbi:transcriptional regulator [Candidatus Bathyarchaeota archaeon]|nr:MAG: transcriptional regulator [Candidatus Bathyarchaeota archaeon]
MIHESARLNITAHLYVVESADFLFLKYQTQLTIGSLFSHLSKLEAAGYTEAKKGFVGKKPYTVLHLTKKDCIAFQKYRRSMKQISGNSPNESK